MSRLTPSDRSALVVCVALPAPLEALRRRGVAEGANGLPAHLTLLYPFADPDQIDVALEATIGSIASAHPAHVVRLLGPRSWPDVIYAAVEPEAPVRALHADLAAAFPTLPLYGGSFEFDPHVTVAEGGDLDSPGLATDPAWDLLPAMADVDGVDLIVRDPGGWRLRRRFDLAPRG
jgi:2'-5' RNA ligase